VVEWLIASCRDLDISRKGKNCNESEYTTLEIARKMKRTDVVALLERFIANPTQTRHEVQATLGVLDELAAEVFALTIFLSDDLLQLKPALKPSNPVRFFTIALKLPMELQMILCRRAVGSLKQIILHKDSEAAFKSLARVLILQPTSP